MRCGRDSSEDDLHCCLQVNCKLAVTGCFFSHLVCAECVPLQHPKLSVDLR